MSKPGEVGSGLTNQYVGSVSTTAAPIPTTPSRNIRDWLVKCSTDQTSSFRLLYSLDGGTTYATIAPGEAEWGSLLSPITQIYIKAASGTVAYEITISRV